VVIFFYSSQTDDTPRKNADPFVSVIIQLNPSHKIKFRERFKKDLFNANK